MYQATLVSHLRRSKGYLLPDLPPITISTRSSGGTIDNQVEYSTEIRVTFHDESEWCGRYRKLFPAIRRERSYRAYRRYKRQQLVGYRVTEATSAGCQERRLQAVYTRFLGIPAAFIGRRIDDQSLFTSGCRGRHAAVTRHQDYFQSAVRERASAAAQK